MCCNGRVLHQCGLIPTCALLCTCTPRFCPRSCAFSHYSHPVDLFCRRWTGVACVGAAQLSRFWQLPSCRPLGRGWSCPQRRRAQSTGASNLLDVYSWLCGVPVQARACTVGCLLAAACADQLCCACVCCPLQLPTASLATLCVTPLPSSGDGSRPVLLRCASFTRHLSLTLSHSVPVHLPTLHDAALAQCDRI